MTAAFASHIAADHLSSSLTSINIRAARGTVDVIDRFAEEWRGLCSEAANDQPFYRPEWIGAFVRAFVPGAKILLITARLENRLVLVLPLLDEIGTFSKIPLRKLRAPVDSYAGRFDAVYRAGPEGEAAILAVWKYLSDLKGWDMLQLRDALHGSAISRLAAAARVDGLNTIELEDKPSPIVPVPVPADVRKLLPANSRLRRELRSVRRQVAEKGSALKFSRIDAAKAEALNRFYRLEASGWKGQEHCAILSKGTRPFLDEVAQQAARLGYFTLYLLELDGELIAGHYGFTLRDCYYSTVVSYNENFRDYSPGHLLIDEIVNDCAERGIRTYQTTGQNQEWKMRWTAQTQPISHHYIFRGRLGNLAYRVESRLRPRIGRWLFGQSVSSPSSTRS